MLFLSSVYRDIYYEYWGPKIHISPTMKTNMSTNVDGWNRIAILAFYTVYGKTKATDPYCWFASKINNRRSLPIINTSKLIKKITNSYVWYRNAFQNTQLLFVSLTQKIYDFLNFFSFFYFFIRTVITFIYLQFGCSLILGGHWNKRTYTKQTINVNFFLVFFFLLGSDTRTESEVRSSSSLSLDKLS